MKIRQIVPVIALVSLAAVTAYGPQLQASSQGGMQSGMQGMSDGMQQNGSTEKAPKESAQEYKITLRTEPNPAKGSQENTFHLSVADATGKPVSDAKVKLTLDMPAMPEMNMAAMKVSPALAWSGSDYSGKSNLPSAGLWNVTVQVMKQDRVIASKKLQLAAK
jgi:nitrogen fixation protein FixH